MIDRLSDFMDDHPQLYLLAAAVFVYAGVMYLDDAQDMVKRYKNAKDISREVSEALGG